MRKKAHDVRAVIVYYDVIVLLFFYSLGTY